MLPRSSKRQMTSYEPFSSTISRPNILFLLFFIWIQMTFFLPSTFASVPQTIDLDSGQEKCWTIHVPSDITMVLSGDYEMFYTEDEEVTANPLYLVLTADDKKDPIYISPFGESYGDFSFVTRGRHRFCITNGIERNPMDGSRRREDGVSRTVAFSIEVRPYHLSESQGSSKGVSGPKTSAMSNTVTLSQKLGDNLLLLLHHIEYLKEQERFHKDMTSNTLALLWRWTVLEAVALIGIAFAQIYYFRRFFETKRYL